MRNQQCARQMSFRIHRGFTYAASQQDCTHVPNNMTTLMAQPKSEQDMHGPAVYAMCHGHFERSNQLGTVGNQTNTLRCAGVGGYNGPAGTSGCIGSKSFAGDCMPVATALWEGWEFKVLPVPSATAIAIVKTPHTPTAATATAPKASIHQYK